MAVAAGVATAVAVLAGALLVGASVRASLRDLITERLGRTTYVATGATFFREALAAETGGAPLIVIEAVVTNPETKRRASAVSIYGVDERFFAFHGWTAEEGTRVSNGLAREVGAGELLIRMEKPSAIPKESLHGRKDEGKTLRVQAQVSQHDFALKPQQGEVLAMFVPLRRLQRELGQASRVNTILYASAAPPDIRDKVKLDDIGVRVRPLTTGGLSIESESAIVNESLATAAGPAFLPVFSYLANSIRIGDREIPYSLVTAVSGSMLPIPDGSIVLNDWAARELSARPGETARLDYYVWSDGGSLLTRSATLLVHRTIPISGIAADRELTPEYPGITEAKSIHDWDPPFPMNLSLIKPRDEAYWEKYRTTPKAFISIADGRKLWGTRFGRATSLRIASSDAAEVSRDLRSKLDPQQFGLAVYPVRSESFEGARGSTDFGEYFAYFSFFLVVSAALLAGLFFRLGVEQRFREIGTLRSLGWPMSKVRTVLLAEGAALAAAGSLVGMVGAVAYCAFVLYGLRTWWRGAVGTTSLRLHVDPTALLSGAAMGGLIALIVIYITLRGIQKLSPRALLAGSASSAPTGRARNWVRFAAAISALGALGMTVAGVSKSVEPAAAFFGAGTLLLMAALFGMSIWLCFAKRRFLSIVNSPTLWNLGFRNTSHRPGRSLLCIALIASAVFLIVALDTFRQSGAESHGPKSGSGGFPLIAESQIPLLWNPNTGTGRESLNLAPVADKLTGVRFYAFRLKPGEDASCLNLYEPRNPRVIGAPADFIAQGRFAFAGESKDPKDNPWLLLDSDAGGATPAIADANSITYVLHKKVGDEVVVDGHRLRLVAALSGSVLQSELIVSEKNFVKLWPNEQGYRTFLIDAPSVETGQILEEALSDYGFDATSTADRLAAFHRVENTYLSTFQALGALGLLLGTVGLAAVLLRNVLERRREMALLGALGYRRDQLGRVVLAENAFLVLCGLVIGAASAAIAVAPAAIERGGSVPIGALLILMVAVPATALISSLLAVRVVQRAPLLEALRAE